MDSETPKGHFMNDRQTFSIAGAILIGIIVLDWIGDTFGAFYFWTTIIGAAYLVYRALKETGGWNP